MKQEIDNEQFCSSFNRLFKLIKDNPDVFR